MSEPFGTYELLERIAVGGMAEVYLAVSHDDQLKGRPLVVKRMLPQLAESPEHVTMFLDEARLGALLKHRNIVEVFDVGQLELLSTTSKSTKCWYMALEYIDGPDLGQILKTARDAKQPLPHALSAFVIARAAEGLHFAHNVIDPKTNSSLGVIHRDVSPQNILVARNGAVKVMDFGVAKSEQQMHKTQSGLVKGKIAYMSPEQISAQAIDVRTDVLALGVCLWESLTHKRMYGGLSDVEIMKRVYFDTPPLASSVVAVDETLDAIVARALARRKIDRFASARELMEALDAWCAQQAAPPSEPAVSTWMKARFVPRAVVADAATAWAYKSPARGSSLGDAGVDITETTILDERAAFLGDGAHEGAPQPPDAAADAADVDAASEKRVRQTIPKGTVLKPLKRMSVKPLQKRDLVLYVEDEQQNWEVAELLLKKSYDLVHAPDDQMACELLRTRGKELTAVLMDIQLKGSELDGIALVKLIRGALHTTMPSYARGVPLLQIPIFFVTAYAARYSEKELLAYGADKLVTKPVDFAQLTLALTSYQLRRAAAQSLSDH